MKTPISILMAFLLLNGLSFAQSSTDELTELAKQLADNSSRTVIIKSLEPSMDDLQKIFVTTQDVNDAWMHLQYYYVDVESIEVSPKEEQSEIKVYKISGAELSSGVESSIPEKYYKIGGHMKPDVFMYMVEYTAAGEESGYMTGAFFNVRNHWVFIPDAFDVFVE